MKKCSGRIYLGTIIILHRYADEIWSSSLFRRLFFQFFFLKSVKVRRYFKFAMLPIKIHISILRLAIFSYSYTLIRRLQNTVWVQQLTVSNARDMCLVFRRLCRKFIKQSPDHTPHFVGNITFSCVLTIDTSTEYWSLSFSWIHFSMHISISNEFPIWIILHQYCGISVSLDNTYSCPRCIPTFTRYCYNLGHLCDYPKVQSMHHCQMYRSTKRARSNM